MSEQICRKCLLREIDQHAYLQNIQNRIESLDDDIRTEAGIYERRLTACKACSYLKDGFCGACGCFVELRAAVNINQCPYEKWQQV